VAAAPIVLTLVSAALYSLAFPPLSFSALAWVALVPLFVAAATVPPRRAAACGMLWGVALGVGVGWCLPGMLDRYFGLSPLVGWAALVAVGIGHAGIYVAVFAAWLSWLARRGAGPLAIAAGWGVCEFARSRLLIGNPWALLGYSQVGVSPVMQLADVAGPYGVGVLVAAANAALAGILAPALRPRRPFAALAAVAAALAASLVYGEWRLGQTFASGEPLAVTIVQGAVERAFRWQPEYRTLGLDRYVALTEAAAPPAPGLVVWPENAVDFYLQDPSAERDTLLGAARGLRSDLILGGPSYAYGPAGIRYHNSVWLVRAGRLAGRYDKVRLVPFAEASALAAGGRFEPGRGVHTLRAGPARVGAFVCFEAMYPELVRRFAQGGAEVLANLSNDAWFGSGAPAEHHLRIASVRAIENRRYLLRATTTGISAVIDPYGRIVARSRFGAPAVLRETIRASRVQTPYQRWGDSAAWLAVAFALASTLWHARAAVVPQRR